MDKLSQVILEMKKDLKNHAIKVVFHKNKRLKADGVWCSGFFDESIQELHVAVKRDDWFRIFLHEYCHFRQWVENDPTSVNLENNVFFQWIDGDDYKRSHVLKSLKTIIANELNCEKRVRAFIQKHKLPLSLNDQAQTANAYLLGHHEMYRRRKWFYKSPWLVREYFSQMPKNLTSSNYLTISSTKNKYDFSKVFN